MVIACSPCSGGPLWEGNRTREADRYSSKHMDTKGAIPPDRERVSPSASEPDSASLYLMGAAKRPGKLKPATCGEETSICTCRASRGDRGGRARKDAPRNLGDPLRLGDRAGG